MHPIEPTGRRRSWAGAVGVAIAAALVAVACAPAPSSPPVTMSPVPRPPVVSWLDVVAPRTEAPVTATIRWAVSDPNGDPLVCTVDLDGDGSVDRTIDPCPDRGDLLVQYRAAGSPVPTLSVSDGDFPAVERALAHPITVTPGPSEPFDITLLFDPGIAPEYRAAFEAAAARWEQVIVDGWAPEPLSIPEGFLGWIPAYDGSVDDVVIAARAPYLDGPRGLLGQAGALGNRSSTGQPYFGVMEFDSADLATYAANGRLNDLILHEMGHILGIGLNWAGEGRIDDLLTDPTYNGPAAMAAWHELGGTGQVPVEDQGGIGTWGAHWRESVFDNELMTGYSDGDERMSRVTIGALADRGDGVDLDAADAYALPSAGARAAMRSGSVVDPDSAITHLDPLPDEVLQR